MFREKAIHLTQMVIYIEGQGPKTLDFEQLTLFRKDFPVQYCQNNDK